MCWQWTFPSRFLQFQASCPMECKKNKQSHLILQESIPRLFNEGRTIMTTRCAPACSQVLPVKHQRCWSVSRVSDRRIWSRRWRSSGPSSLMKLHTHIIAIVLEYIDNIQGAVWNYTILTKSLETIFFLFLLLFFNKIWNEANPSVSTYHETSNMRPVCTAPTTYIKDFTASRVISWEQESSHLLK